MEENEFELKKQRILSPIFKSHKEILEIKEKDIEKEKRRLVKMKTINQEFIANMREIPITLGDLFREFELKKQISKDTKEYVSELWDFLSKELPKRLESGTLRKQIEKRKKEQAIKFHKKRLLQLQRPDRYKKRFNK